MMHELKTIPPYFADVTKGKKTFEVRVNDRDFQEGDYLTLREFIPTTQNYSGRRCVVRVTYILRNYLPDTDIVVMGIEGVSDHDDRPPRTLAVKDPNYVVGGNCVVLGGQTDLKIGDFIYIGDNRRLTTVAGLLIAPFAAIPSYVLETNCDRAELPFASNTVVSVIMFHLPERL